MCPIKAKSQLLNFDNKTMYIPYHKWERKGKNTTLAMET